MQLYLKNYVDILAKISLVDLFKHHNSFKYTFVRLKFKIMSIYMLISRFRCGVDRVYFVLACQKSFSCEALLFQINLPLLDY